MSKIVLDGSDINGLTNMFVKGVLFDKGTIKYNDVEICQFDLATSVNFKDLNISVTSAKIDADGVSLDFKVNKKV